MVDPPLSRQIATRLSIWLLSLLSGLSISLIAISLQWLIYDDWMHRNGSLRLVGSVLAGTLMSVVVFRWKLATRRRKLEMLTRFETIKRMNDRIRNALQAIECVTFASYPDSADAVRDAVDIIEVVLNEVLVEAHPAAPRSAPQLIPEADPFQAAGKDRLATRG